MGQKIHFILLFHSRHTHKALMSSQRWGLTVLGCGHWDCFFSFSVLYVSKAGEYLESGWEAAVQHLLQSLHVAHSLLQQCRGSTKVMRCTNIPSLHELSGCVHDATKISHHTENKQKWHVASVDIITKLLLFLFYFLRLLSGRWKRNPWMQEDSFPSDQPVLDKRRWIDVLSFYGVCAMPRLDFIYSSLLERWLLFDSSSSTLSSADRNYRIERRQNVWRLKPVLKCYNGCFAVWETLPLSAFSVSPPSARPPPSLRSLLQTCIAPPDLQVWSPKNQKKRNSALKWGCFHIFRFLMK